MALKALFALAPAWISTLCLPLTMPPHPPATLAFFQQLHFTLLLWHLSHLGWVSICALSRLTSINSGRWGTGTFPDVFRSISLASSSWQGLTEAFLFFSFFFIIKVYLFILRERERERERKRERGREYPKQALSGPPRARCGIELTNHEIMTWAKNQESDT